MHVILLIIINQHMLMDKLLSQLFIIKQKYVQYFKLHIFKLVIHNHIYVNNYNYIPFSQIKDLI